MVEDTWTVEEDVRREEVEGVGQVLFCHGSPRSDEEIVRPRLRPKGGSEKSSPG